MNQRLIQRKTVISVFVSAMVAASFSVSAETLSEVVAKTLKSNPEVLADINARLASDEVIKQAASGYKPTLDIEAGIGREWTDSPTTQSRSVNLKRGESSFKATQKLYDGSNTKYQVDRSEAMAAAAAHQIADTSQRVAFNAVQAYLDILRTDELVAIAQENLTSHESVNEKIGLKVKSGVARAADVDQATARLSLSQSNLFEAEGNQTDATTRYKRVVGETPTSALEPQADCCLNTPKSLEEALTTAMEQHPALAMSVAQHEAALAETGVADSAFQPKVNLEVEGSADNNLDGTEGHDKDLLAMVRLKQNLLNGGADSARIAETGHLSAQQKELALSKQREVEEDVRLSWSATERAASQLPFLKQHADATKKSYEAYQQQFSLGQRTLLDLLDMENEKFTSQTAYINASYDHKIACYQLLASMGILTEKLNVDLAEESKTTR